MSSILKGLTESYFSRDEQDQQNAMDTRRRSDLSGERNSGLNEPDELPTTPQQSRNGVYEYNVPTGQEKIAQALGLQSHKGHWFSRVPVQRANFQFGRPQFHEIPAKNVAEAEQDYGPDYQDKVKRLGQMAKQGERKTVWDPVKRVYKTVPVNSPKSEVKEGSDQKFIVTYYNVNSGKTYTALVPADDEYEARDKINDTAGFGTRVQKVIPARGNEPVDQEWKLYVDPRGNGSGRPMLVDKEQGVAEGFPKDPNAPKLVQDRKTGKWYDPNKEFDKKMNSPEVIAQMKRMAQKESIAEEKCPECGGPMFSDLILAEKKDACYNKVRSRYKVWPSAYASGALVQCRKKGASNWGNKSEDVAEGEYNPDTFVGKKGTYKGYGITQEGPRQWGISSSARKFPTLAAAKRHIDKVLVVSEQGVAEGSSTNAEVTKRAKAAAQKAGKTFNTDGEYRLWYAITTQADAATRKADKKQGVAEEQLDEKCWDTHKQIGMKNKGGKSVPNCVPKESAIMKGLQS